MGHFRFMDRREHRRRWFQFSLRSLLVFMLICALGSAWIGHRMAQKRKELIAAEAVVRLGGRVRFDYQQIDMNAKPPGAAWLRTFLGENFFSSVWDASFQQAGPKVNDASLA